MPSINKKNLESNYKDNRKIESRLHKFEWVTSNQNKIK